jgi:subtilisin family serine protease
VILAVVGLAGPMLLTAPVVLADAEATTYLIVYRSGASSAKAGALVRAAGGTLVANYAEIGVVIARSSNPSFAAAVKKDTKVEGAGSTAALGAKVDGELVDGPPPGDLPNSPANPTGDTFWPLQWDMRQIDADDAQAITGGSSEVVVGDLDTGLDKDHPDLIPNIAWDKSASCESGAPVTDPAAWDDHQGHGTHTAGTIAAAANGMGTVGVAPNVKIAGIKTSNDDGFFYPHMVVCAFMWAAQQGIDVTNNSYFTDPFLYNCAYNADERAIRKAEIRAIRYAQSKGVIVVSSAGNSNLDMTHTTFDPISPSDGDPLMRDVTNACLKIPAEVPGVVTVSATGVFSRKSYYSDYGIGVVDVTAPGGDRRFQIDPGAGALNGRVLSTYILEQPTGPLVLQDCGATGCGKYAYLQGTSMAGPHAAGVLALIQSYYGPLSNGAAISILEQTATALDCPPNPFDPSGDGAFAATCQGGAGYNGFFGHGEVNAYDALTK